MSRGSKVAFVVAVVAVTAVGLYYGSLDTSRRDADTYPATATPPQTTGSSPSHWTPDWNDESNMLHLRTLHFDK